MALQRRRRSWPSERAALERPLGWAAPNEPLVHAHTVGTPVDCNAVLECRNRLV